MVDLNNEIKEISHEMFSLDDLGNAQRMHDMYEDILRYCYDFKSWYIYDNVRWVEDKTENVSIMANDMLKSMEIGLLNEAIKETDPKKSEDMVKAYKKHIKNSRSNKGKNNFLKETMPLLPITSSELDSHIELINAPNGTYNVKTGQLLPHNKDDYITQVTNVPIVEGSKCPMWEKFINQIFLGNKELIKYVQKAVGYSLTGFTKEQCMFILFGDGNNGKGVFVSIIDYIVNDYSKHIQAETISQIRKGSDASPDLMSIKDSRFVFVNESNEEVAFNEALIKQLTGEDKVTGRRLYCPNISFFPHFKIWMSTNYKPKIKGTDNGIWRRLKIIPFELNLQGDEVDTELKNKLKDEAQGILWWCIEGLKLYLKEGLIEPDIVKNSVKEFRDDSNVLKHFITDCVIEKKGSKVRARELYNRYVNWCKENNETAKNSTRFGIDMKKYATKDDTGNYVYYVDIDIRSVFEPKG